MEAHDFPIGIIESNKANYHRFSSEKALKHADSELRVVVQSEPEGVTVNENNDNSIKKEEVLKLPEDVANSFIKIFDRPRRISKSPDRLKL